MKKDKYGIRNIIITLMLLLIMVQILKNPKQSILSAKEGLDIWFNLLLPSLFPFLLISDLLISFGFINFFAKFLEPIMRPIFNVSGIGIFPFSMSIISGYPVGAKLTAKLREKELITNTVGNRLISFSSTSGPLFILGTVLIGMLGSPQLGLLMIAPHYLGAITIGVLFRFYRKNENLNTRIMSNSSMKNKFFINENSEKSIGSLISNSVKDSMDSMLVIGGCIIIYSVIIDIVLSSYIFDSFIISLSKLTSCETSTLKGITAGIIEITKGCDIISKLDITLINKVVIINFLIGWGGLSIHSQALSFISTTDISSLIYILSKFLHGLISSFYTYLIYIFIYKGDIVPTFTNPIPILQNFTADNWFFLLASSAKLALSISLFLFLLSILIHECDNRA